MRKQKASFLAKIFKTGNSFLLLILVVSAVSFLKVQAGTESGKGWLWGGSEEVNDGVINGNETGVGWISMNSWNCDSDSNGITDQINYPNCPLGLSVASYGVNIPIAVGNLSGYAWSENVGWISFNAGDLSGCRGGNCSARREADNHLHGWARIMGIKSEFEKMPSNSGGWSGWIKLHSEVGDPLRYGVEIAKMDGTGVNPTYAWSDELGWIDFSRAKIEFPKKVTLSPPTLLIAGTPGVLMAKLENDPDPAGPGNKRIDIASSDPHFVLSAAYCMTDNSGMCTVSVSALNRSANWSTVFEGRRDSEGFLPGNSDGNIIKALNCSIDCPESVTLYQNDQWKKYKCTVGGDAGCKVDSCVKLAGGSTNVEVQTGAEENTCEARALSSGVRGGQAVSRATTTDGSDDDDTNLIVQPPGHIEVNP